MKNKDQKLKKIFEKRGQVEANKKPDMINPKDLVIKKKNKK